MWCPAAVCVNSDAASVEGWRVCFCRRACLPASSPPPFQKARCIGGKKKPQQDQSRDLARSPLNGFCSAHECDHLNRRLVFSTWMWSSSLLPSGPNGPLRSRPSTPPHADLYLVGISRASDWSPGLRLPPPAHKTPLTYTKRHARCQQFTYYRVDWSERKCSGKR